VSHVITETAINIGYSCQLLTEDMEEVFIIDGETADVVQKQLQQALVDMKDISSDDLNVKTRQENGNSGRVSPFSTDSDNNFAIVVNGCSLVSTLYNDSTITNTNNKQGRAHQKLIIDIALIKISCCILYLRDFVL